MSLVGSVGGFHAQLPPIETMKQRSPVLDPGRFDPELTYVALINSDGDNMGLDNTQLTQSTGLAERARVCAAPVSLCPPIGWTMSNRLAEWAPAIFKYYYESATPADSFLLGPSGYGYIYPSMMDETDKGTLADATADAGKRFDMKGYIACTGNVPQTSSPGRSAPSLQAMRRYENASFAMPFYALKTHDFYQDRLRTNARKTV